MDTNLDTMFMTYIAFFYVYGVYLHSGHEMPWLVDAHNPIVNTSYHHCCHHAVSIKNKPLYTGFFFKIWDRLAGSELEDSKCMCVSCETKKGNRTLEKWEKLEKPDYSVLFQYTFWKKELGEHFGLASAVQMAG